MSTKRSGPRTTRREVLRGAAASLAALPLIGSCGSDAARPPNVLLITADDLGWKDLSSYGNTDIATPNLDRLVSEGVHFTHAFDVTSSCSSSRATYSTGQYPHTHGVTGLAHHHEELSLPAGYPTMAWAFQEACFRTGIEGKWHVAPFDDVELHGYQEFLNLFFLPGAYVIENSERTISFLQRNKDVPWFLEVNYMNNHRNTLGGDFQYAPGFPVDPDGIRVPEFWALPDRPEIREEVARYYSQTLWMDAMVGEVLQALEDLGLSDDTLVAFISDNGPPFPGNKMTLYDRGTGTPMMFRWPGRIEAGSVVETMVPSIDLMPTLLDLAGVAVPEGVQGQTLRPLIEGRSGVATRPALFSEMTYHLEFIPTRAVRTERYKYIRNYSPDPIGLDQLADEEWAQQLVEEENQPWTSPRPEEELYDLLADPNEQTSLVDQPEHAEALTVLRALLDGHMADTDDPLLDSAPMAVTAPPLVNRNRAHHRKPGAS